MLLNYFPIKFDFQEYSIDAIPFDQEHLLNLRRQFNGTHSFFRKGEHIYVSNYSAMDAPSLGQQTFRKNLFDDEQVTSSLIKHLFFRKFKDRFVNYIPVDFYPFRFYSQQEKDDLIRKAMPDSLKDRIGYRKMIEVQLRYTQINGVKQFGFIVNIERNWVFDKNCHTLHLEGYDLKGIEVLHTESFPGNGGVVAPNEEYIGNIVNVAGDHANVQTSEGTKSYPLNELYIRKTKFNIANYLDFATSSAKTSEILRFIEDKRQEIYNTQNQYKEIASIARLLFSQQLDGNPVVFQNKDGFTFSVSNQPLTFQSTFELKTPTFIFDPAGTKTNNVSPDQGLSNFGPYDSINFDIKSPNVICICHREDRGYFTNFLASLKDGMSESRFFKKGLQKKFELNDVNYHIEQIASFDLTEYSRVIKDYDGESKPDLAIIEIPSEFRKLPDVDNPYYKLKAKLLALEIPVQYVSNDKIKGFNEYILNSIALQIYAKLGGTPWVLPAQRSVDRELIIGIGHSTIRKHQFAGAEQNRVVGITTFMSGDGQYLLGEKVKDVSFDDYFRELLNSLTTSFARLEKEQGWSEGDTVRLIFHIFKPIKNTEFDAISAYIKGNSKYRIKFAFVTIGKHHPHLMFDPNQLGVNNKGAFIPNRAVNLFLDTETCLVQMLGAKELKTASQGMSTPIQIKIRIPQGNYDNNGLSELLYYDLAYIVQQIFSFTYLSWRSFLPGELPATMLYSNLISKLLGKMRHVSDWDADTLNYGLKRKKWFL